MTAEDAVSLIREFFDESEKNKYSRYRSWIHCYKAFSQNRKAVNEQTLDYLALHLGFYLASWGMYRGSSFLLYNDYKVHVPVVKIILEERYSPLLGISAESLREESSLNLLADIAQRIKECYTKEAIPHKGNNNVSVTDALKTKILLGTLGCTPAYDSYYTQSVKKHRISSGKFNKESVRRIAEFYCGYLDEFERLRQELKEKSGIEYPPMKLMDMCFWQDGQP